MGSRRLISNPLKNRQNVRVGDPNAHAYHSLWPGYEPTPLRLAPAAARLLGVGSVLVKDESSRLGLPSFKVLGASWATHRSLCARVSLDHRQISGIEELRPHLGTAPLTLVAATDGNHGRAVARMARMLGLAAHILVPFDMVDARVQALKDEGATVTVVDGGYDEAIRTSADLADDSHVVISDTSWPGYAEVPGWVIDGYTTLSLEIAAQLPLLGIDAPTVVAAQMGVGAFGASIARAFRETSTRLVGVEPTRADCVTTSVEAGQLVELTGVQDSIMAGLNCGTPSPIAWPDVSAGFDMFAAIDDSDAEYAMRVLAKDGIVSGESGAAGLAGLLAFGEELGLGPRDRILVVSTEGATDPVGYERALGRAA